MHPPHFAVILPEIPLKLNMKSSSEIIALLKKEILLEWKQKYALYGLLMYSLTMVFVISIGLQNTLPPQAWNVIFWVILLFVSVNAIAKSFMSETEGQVLYMYNLASAKSIILAKLIYNCLLMSGISILTMFFFIFFAFNGEFGDILQYVVVVIVGSWTFAANMSMVSAIAAKAKQRTTLLAVLSFPLVIPQMLVCLSASGKALQGQPWLDSVGEVAFLVSFIVIIAAVSVILFPFLWRD